MLTEKEYLLLCELVSLNKLNTKLNSSGKTVAALLEANKDIINAEIVAKSGLLKLQLKASRISKIVDIFLFADEDGDTCIVFTPTKFSGKALEKEYSEELVKFVKNNCIIGKCVVTGLALGGLYAAYVASQLDLTGIVFGAPSTEELLGNVQNYIGENDPVGEFIEKVVFIKQETTDENINKSYSQTLVFDENGKAVVSEQSEYSKFCSWFYHTAGPVHNEVWRLFFKDTGIEDDLIAPNLYSLFMKTEELSQEGVKNSLQNIVNYLNHELTKSTKTMQEEFRKSIQEIEIVDFYTKLCELAEKTTHSAVAIVKDIYNSVETVLMGVELFTAEKGSCDIGVLMGQFSISVDGILEKEIQRITDFLEQETQNYMELLSIFPELPGE